MDVYKEWLGIPDGPRPPDHYELLRVVRFQDDAEKIRGNYKKLNAHVRKYATGQYSVISQDLLNEMAKAMLCLTDVVRKREYDESLGREFPPERDEFGRQPVLDILVRQGHLSRDQKKEVESFAERRGLSHRDATVQIKLVSPEIAARALADSLGYSYMDLVGDGVTPEDDILDRVSRQMVKAHSFIPLFIDDDKLIVACVDQPEHELEDELRLRYGVSIRPVIATPRAINQAIAKYYAPGMRDEAKIVEGASAGAAGTKRGKESAKSAPKKHKPAAAFSQLSADEKNQRKQLGILLICWSVIIPMLPQIIKTLSPALAARLHLLTVGVLLNVVVSLLIAGGTTWWVTQRYWK